MSSRLLRLPVALALSLLIAPAFAEPTAGDRALAQSLFDEGKALMNEGKYAEACPKLAESQRIDPGTGTLLNLAVCHEKEGKTATAWADFNDALTQSKKDGRADREGFAREHIAALEPKLSRLKINVSGDVEVKLDGAKIGKAAWGSAVPVDPGKHTIEASAANKKPWTGSIDVGPDGDKKEISVPALEDAPVVSTTKPTVATDDTKGSGRKTIGLVVGGVGVVALGVGTVFGLRASSKWGERNDHCTAAGCDAQAVNAYKDAKSAALLADIGLAVGVVAIGAGVVLFVTAPSSEKTTAVHVVPSVSTNAGGLSVLGSF